MPNYYNPSVLYPATYQNPYAPYYSGTPLMQQSYAPQPQPQQSQLKAMEWVDGEVGAKAFQMPPNWPINTPIPLWDNSAKKIYLKSWNQMGAANYPMQVLDYEFHEDPDMTKLPSASGNANPAQANTDMSQYVTKQDLEQLRQEFRNMRNNKDRNNQENRGENR